MSGRVLVTRPEPGASRTAARLAALGRQAVVLPLTEIRAVSPPAIGNTGRFGAVAVSSANAVRHAGRPLLDALAGLPGFAVGARTADAMAEAGLPRPLVGPGGGEGLAEMIAARLPSGASIAYLCGRLRSPGFERALMAAGLAVSPVETYDTVELSYGDDELTARLDGPPLAAALVHSRVAAAALARLAHRPATGALFEGTTFLCISARASAPLSMLGATDLRVAAAPTEDAMLALLGEAF